MGTRQKLLLLGILLVTGALVGVDGAHATLYRVVITTEALRGSAGAVAFDFTSTIPNNQISILNFSHDGRAGLPETSGGLVEGDLILLRNPAPFTRIADGSFFNELVVPFDSLGLRISFSLQLTENAPPAGELPDEFSFFLLGEDRQVLFPTADPLGADALFSICIDGTTTGALEPFQPTRFIPPDSLKVTVEGIVDPSPNLVGNPSFETGLDGWNGYGHGTLTRVAGGQEGGSSAQIVGPSPNTGDFGLNDSPSWILDAGPAGTRYEISAYVRSATSTSPVRLRIREYKNRVRVGSRVYSETSELTSDWQQIGMEYVSRASGTMFDFQVLDIGDVPGDVFQVDNIVIRKLSTGVSVPMSIAHPSPSDPVGTDWNFLIQWVSPPSIDPDSVVVMYSGDAGESWNTVGSVAEGNALIWHTPSSATGSAAVMVVAYAGGQVVADGVTDLFAIDPNATLGTNSVSMPAAVYLMPARPSPFRGSTMIDYGLPTTSRVRVEVFDLGGRAVRTLVDQVQGPGRFSVPWRGAGEDNRRLPAGIYMIRLKTGGVVKIRRTVLLW